MPKLGMEPIRRQWADLAHQMGQNLLPLVLWIQRSLFRQNADPDAAVELVERAVFRALDRADA